jgi:hypothetical protein
MKHPPVSFDPYQYFLTSLPNIFTGNEAALDVIQEVVLFEL